MPLPRARGVAGFLVALASWAVAPTAARADSAPAAPFLIAPASGATISANAPQVFTIEAIDPDGDPYSGAVTVSDAQSGRLFVAFSTVPAASGQSSSATPTVPLPPGTYTWTASATDLFGNDGPPAASQPFTVAGAPDAGGGALTGSVSFSQPIPPTGEPCAQTSFTLTGTSAASVVSFAQAEFTGPLTVTGSGGGSCETAGTGGGSLVLSADGLGVTGTTIHCPQLSGSYFRAGTDVTATVSGPCTLNGTETDSLTIDAKVQFVPSGGGAGRPVQSADFHGAFAVSPAT
jgi:hypothetical protein